MVREKMGQRAEKNLHPTQKKKIQKCSYTVILASSSIAVGSATVHVSNEASASSRKQSLSTQHDDKLASSTTGCPWYDDEEVEKYGIRELGLYKQTDKDIKKILFLHYKIIKNSSVSLGNVRSGFLSTVSTNCTCITYAYRYCEIQWSKYKQDC